MADEEKESNIDEILADAIKDFNLDDDSTNNVEGEASQVPGMQDFLKLLNDPSSKGPFPSPPAGPDKLTMPSEADLEEMFAEFASQTSSTEGGASAHQQEFLPVLESMMKSILSKDLLYPPLKDLCDKYPEWLADKRTQLSEEEYKQYNNQFQVAQQIVQLFEQQENQQDFNKILELMQTMQTYGHPPKELISGNSPQPEAINSIPSECKVQ